MEDAWSDRFINGPLREEARRLREAEAARLQAARAEQRRRDEEEERLRRERLEEEIANRPKVCFGMKPRMEPQRPSFSKAPPQAQTQPVPDEMSLDGAPLDLPDTQYMWDGTGQSHQQCGMGGEYDPTLPAAYSQSSFPSN
eukprot:6458032-Amphidinium_carterae.1